MQQSASNNIVIIGGGTAGITVAAQLRKKLPNASITLIEPSEQHYYQPMWTLVGGGIFPREKSGRPMKDFIPPGVKWVKDRVTTIDPDANKVTTANGTTFDYEYLIVAPGLKINWDEVPGLRAGMGTRNICSNYSYDYASYTWDCIRNFKGGTALFTAPNTAVKCGGAPQKIMYLACDYWRKQGILDKCNVIYATAQPKIFQVEKYAATLQTVLKRYGIQTRFKHHLVELNADRNEAVLENLDTKGRETIAYDMIHVTPPMGPPDVVKQSKLANDVGYCEVDKHTLAHVRYPNVFAIGDASNLPTSKTGAAIRKQAPALVANLLSTIEGKPMLAKYDGYTSCPLVTAYGKMVLAEFDYDFNSQESFPIDQSKERWSMWLLKLYGLPALYWHGMLRGRA